MDARVDWMDQAEIESARERLPIVYIDAIPVRLDSHGNITSVGLLLRGLPDGQISYALVSGRVLYGERIREALIRHLEKDLGMLALPQLPPALQPFTVVEYFPNPEKSGFHDPRQHAVSLAYIIPISGECQPTSAALELAWMEPKRVITAEFQSHMAGGRGKLIYMAIAHCGMSID